MVTRNIVKKVINDLESSSKASGPDCISMMELKHDFSCILAELFNMYLKESFFLNCWKVNPVVPLCKNAGKISVAKTYQFLIFFLWKVESLKNFM